MQLQIYDLIALTSMSIVQIDEEKKGDVVHIETLISKCETEVQDVIKYQFEYEMSLPEMRQFKKEHKMTPELLTTGKKAVARDVKKRLIEIYPKFLKGIEKEIQKKK